MITARVPMETIYEEIPHVRAQLREEAEQLVATLAVEAEHDDKVRFREAYAQSIRPFLEAPETAGMLRSSNRCAGRRPVRSIRLSTIWKTSAKRSASSAASAAFTTGCTPGCWCTSRFRSPCWCWAASTPSWR